MIEEWTYGWMDGWITLLSRDGEEQKASNRFDIQPEMIACELDMKKMR